MYTKRRLEQIDQCRDAAHEAMLKYAKFKEWGDPVMASYYLDIKTILHRMASELERRERKQAAALDALQAAKVEEGDALWTGA